MGVANVPRPTRSGIAVQALAVATILIAALPLPASADAPSAFEITDAGDLLPGPAAEGQIGDFILRNGEIAVIIEDVGHAHGYGLSGGNLSLIHI